MLNEKGQCIVAFTPIWQWNPERNALVAQLAIEQTAELLIFTKPAEPGTTLASDIFDARRQQCMGRWIDVLNRSVHLSVPGAHRYGRLASNSYWQFHDRRGRPAALQRRQRLRQALRRRDAATRCDRSCCSAISISAPAMLKPMLEFDRQDTRFHVAGHKLQLLAYFYWVTRDADTVRAYEPLWRPSVELILTSREPESGLLPKDRYAGDIAENVYSLNSNANCWRGLRDVAAMLRRHGRRADEATTTCKRWPPTTATSILAAVSRSERLDAEAAVHSKRAARR